MKRAMLVALIAFLGLSSIKSAFSQTDSVPDFKLSVDLYSSYIWRGSELGKGPAIQPSIKYTVKSLSLMAWGSFDFNGYQETDLYLSYALPAGFSVGLSDYYLSNLKYFDCSNVSGSHAFELSLNFTKGKCSLSANYILNKAGGIGSQGDDKYFEAAYAFKKFDVFLGAGDGWYTYNPKTNKDQFALCNIGIGTTRKLKITETFVVPIKGQLIFNPDKEQMFIVAGFNF